MEPEPVNSLQDIADLIKSPGIKVVSFDLFDTLLYRPTAFPRDIIELYDDDFRKIIKAFPLYSFRQDRFALEDDCRKQALDADQEEITFDEIYTHIQKELLLDGNIVKQLKKRELEIEKRHLELRKSAKSLFDQAKRAGKITVFISDMYLPALFLESVLKDQGITGYHKLYVSSEYGQKKRSQRLFRLVLDDLPCQPQEMVHIGDNFQVDVIPARKAGIRAVHFPKAIDRFLSLEGNRTLRNANLKKADLGYRVVIGLIANKIFDDPYRSFEENSLFNGDLWTFGYLIFGPLMFFMTKWILEESVLEGADEILFLARDGFVLIQLFECLKKYYEIPPKTRYLASSRNVFLSQTLSQKEFLTLTKHYVVISGRHITLRKLLVERFGIALNRKTKAFFKDNGFSQFDSPIHADERKILKTIKKLHRSIVTVNREKAHLAKRYYRQFFDDTKKQMCFDIGWRGSSQLYLSRLLGQPIDFFYLACNNFAFTNQAKYGLRTKPYMPFKNKFFFNFDAFQLLAETVFGDPESSTCIGFYETEGEVAPKLSRNAVPVNTQNTIRAIHKGIFAFCDDLTKHLGKDIRRLHVIPEHLITPLTSFVSAPFKIDVVALRHLCSENILAAGKMLYLLDFWDQGRRALECQGKEPKHEKTQGFQEAAENDSFSLMVLHLKRAFIYFRKATRKHLPHTTRYILSPPYKLFKKLTNR